MTVTYYIVQELCSLIFKKSPKKKNWYINFINYYIVQELCSSIWKKSKKNIGTLIFLKCFVPAQYKKDAVCW